MRRNVAINDCKIIFVREQCSWLSWVFLAHKFTSPQTYVQVYFNIIKRILITLTAKLCL